MTPQLQFYLFACLVVIQFCIAWILLHPASASKPQMTPAVVPAKATGYNPGSSDVIYIDTTRPGCGVEIRKQHQAGYMQLADKAGPYVVMVRLNGKHEGAW